MKHLASVVLSTVLLLRAAVAVQDQRETRPNIIFIMSDDHAAHAIGAYGSRVNKTPNLDRLAHEGALLTNVFATNSICSAPVRSRSARRCHGIPTSRPAASGRSSTAPTSNTTSSIGRPTSRCRGS